VRNFPYILPWRTDGRKLPHILGKPRKLLPILLIGPIERILLSILPVENPPKQRLEQAKDPIQRKHDSYRTEDSDVQWIRRYILFHNCRPIDGILWNK
jgi:hypothetical protein